MDSNPDQPLQILVLPTKPQLISMMFYAEQFLV